MGEIKQERRTHNELHTDGTRSEHGREERDKPRDHKSHQCFGHIMNSLESVTLNEVENFTCRLHGQFRAWVMHFEYRNGNHVELMRPRVHFEHEKHRDEKFHNGFVEDSEE